MILARTWKTSGYGEAAVGEMSFPLFPTDNPSLGVYAKQDGIHLQLKVTAHTIDEAGKLLAAGESKIRQVFGSTIWGTDEETLEIAVGKLLLAQGKSLGVIEDYTSGCLTASLADVENSPSFLKGGVTAVRDEAKIAMGVPAVALSRGSVSAEVAVAMAEAARARFGADIGIGISGTQAAEANGAVHYAISDGTVSEAMVHPRGKERLATTVLFELRKLLLSRDG